VIIFVSTVVRGIEFIKSLEEIADGDPSTVNHDPYLDPVGIWTIRLRHAIRVGMIFCVARGTRPARSPSIRGGLAMEQAETLLGADVLDKCRDRPVNHQIENSRGATRIFAVRDFVALLWR
jgi:GH24 family phage-related lysozyme (muramidase)